MSRFGDFAMLMGESEEQVAAARHRRRWLHQADAADRRRNYARHIADAYDAAHHEIEDGAAMDLTRPDRFEQE